MAVKLIALALLASLAGCASFSKLLVFGDSQSSGTDKSQGLMRLAADIEANGNKESAITLYREAVAASGHAPISYVRLGDACLRTKKLTEAIRAYRAALAKDPDNADALLGLGTAFARQGALEKGLAALTKAAPRVNTGAAYNRLGVAQTIAGQFPEAQAAFEKGRAIEPDDLDIAVNLALAAAMGGQSAKAVALSSVIAQSATVQPVHRRNLVIVLGVIGRSAEEARAVAPPGLSQSEFDALFGRAESIRHIADPKARARALGTMQG